MTECIEVRTGVAADNAFGVLHFIATSREAFVGARLISASRYTESVCLVMQIRDKKLETLFAPNELLPSYVRLRDV